jgi:hypothetical protein
MSMKDIEQRAMIVATRLFDYRGQPMAQWFAALPWLDRVRAFTIIHEATRDTFDGAGLDDADLVQAASLRYHEENDALLDRAFKRVPVHLRPDLNQAIG